MKRRSLTSGTAIRLFVIILLICPRLAFSQDIDSTLNERKAQLSYVGSQDDNSIFLMQVKNDKAERIFLTIQQRGGQILYRENFTDTFYSRRFFLPREIATDVIFVVSGMKDKDRQTFQLNSRVVEQMFISKSN